jgi:predicted permease
LQHVDLGYPTDRLLLVNVNSRIAGYDTTRSIALFRELLDRIQRIPGVTAASLSLDGLFTGAQASDRLNVEGFVPKTDKDQSSRWDMVGPRYFSSLHVPILAGREILDSDQGAASKVCVINQAFAKQYFAGRNPVGLHISVLADESSGDRVTTYEVVGVARNYRTSSLREDVKSFLYMPITQPSEDVKRASFVIRISAANSGVLTSVRQAIRQVDPSLPITSARSMEEQLAPSTASARATAQVAEVFGCIALALAAIGLYGVLSHNIARRRGEIAIRIALGAQPVSVVRMILRETGVLVVAGLLVGSGLTYAASRWIAEQLYGVSPLDPTVATVSVALLLLVAFGAVYVPARRASRIAPMAALRQE